MRTWTAKAVLPTPPSPRTATLQLSMSAGKRAEDGVGRGEKAMGRHGPQSAGKESVDCADLGRWSAGLGGAEGGGRASRVNDRGWGVVKGARGKLEEKRTIKDNKQIYVVQVSCRS